MILAIQDRKGPRATKAKRGLKDRKATKAKRGLKDRKATKGKRGRRVLRATLVPLATKERKVKALMISGSKMGMLGAKQIFSYH